MALEVISINLALRCFNKTNLRKEKYQRYKKQIKENNRVYCINMIYMLINLIIIQLSYNINI